MSNVYVRTGPFDDAPPSQGSFGDANDPWTIFPDAPSGLANTADPWAAFPDAPAQAPTYANDPWAAFSDWPPAQAQFAGDINPFASFPDTPWSVPTSPLPSNTLWSVKEVPPMGALFSALRLFGDFAYPPASDTWAMFPDWPPTQARPVNEANPSNPFLNALEALNPIGTAEAQRRRYYAPGETGDLTAPIRQELWGNAWRMLRELDPNNRELPSLSTQDWVPRNEDIARINSELQKVVVQRLTDFLMPGGQSIGMPGGRITRTMTGGEDAARAAFDYLSRAGKDVTPFGYDETLVELPGKIWVGFRRSRDGATVDVNVPGVPFRTLHFPPE